MLGEAVRVRQATGRRGRANPCFPGDVREAGICFSFPEKDGVNPKREH